MAGNANIFLGSGASLTLVPELDIYFPIHSGSGTGLSTATGIKADTKLTVTLGTIADVTFYFG